MSRYVQRDFGHFVLYIFGFILLWEWLRPLETITDTTNVHLFILFVLICFVLSFFQMKRWISALIKVIYILYCLNDIYYLFSFLSFNWISALIAEIYTNIQFIFEAEWGEMTDLFRSLLFFILLWLMAYLIHYWLMIKRKIFLFFFLTILYISVLDTFTPYNAKFAIIRTVIVGFGSLGILAFYRVMNKENMPTHSFFARKWMIPLSLMLIFSTSIGILAPKAGPQWPDPVPFIQSLNNKSGSGSGQGSGIGRVGYSVDDSRLGGPFLGDDRLVFEAKVKSRHYWRVETKDVYTGKGWEHTPNLTIIPFRDGETVPLTFFESQFEDTEETAEINVELEYSHIVYPQGLKMVNGGENYTYHLDSSKERIVSIQNYMEIPLKTYSLTYSLPKYTISSLRSVNSPTGMSEKEYRRYTQLPSTLPDRVKKLAEEITAGKDNWFDQAKAIEDYFNQPKYIYDQFNVAIPGEDDDYVDQFLFETMRGYCDNFSTSMIVLLRSIGIPARWVKGYTDGEFKGYDRDGKAIYEITNNNAHSWVEVYFPNVGWVPFEPTKGFDNRLRIDYEIDSDGTNNSGDVETPQYQTPEPPENDSLTSNKSNNSGEGFFARIWTFINYNWHYFFFSFLFIALAAYVFHRTRIKWMPYWLMIRYRKNDIDTFMKAYLSLIKQLRRYGFSFNDNMTLREFASEIDSYFNTKEMSTLTSKYERIIYRGKHMEDSWEPIRPIWERLLKRTTS
jgi:transglutaminase-like putative cysteine protease